MDQASETLRFVTASDGHLGEDGTDSRRFLAEFVAAVNRLHAVDPVDFAVLNGDIGHGGRTLLEEARAGLDGLAMPYFASQGNHDGVSATDWEDVWGRPANLVHRVGARSIVIANTSNEAGDYLCPDPGWLRQALAGEAGQQDVFAFLHITPHTWTRFGIACDTAAALFAGTPNLRAVFNGHDHDEAGLKVDRGVPYFFDAHYGGHWGTPYRAFRVVEVAAGRLTTRLVSTDGTRLPVESLTW